MFWNTGWKKWKKEISSRLVQAQTTPIIKTSDNLIFSREIYDNLYSTCLKSLNETETKRRLEEIKSSFKATYNWLFELEISFSDWLTEKRSTPVYWIQGKPGSGKSTVMKYIMAHSLTQKRLKKYNTTSPWLITSYFFTIMDQCFKNPSPDLSGRFFIRLYTSSRDLSSHPSYLPSDIQPKILISNDECGMKHNHNAPNICSNWREYKIRYQPLPLHWCPKWTWRKPSRADFSFDKDYSIN
jgi:hypothetical protein